MMPKQKLNTILCGLHSHNLIYELRINTLYDVYKILIEKQILKIKNTSICYRCMLCSITSNGMLQNHCTLSILQGTIQT